MRYLRSQFSPLDSLIEACVLTTTILKIGHYCYPAALRLKLSKWCKSKKHILDFAEIELNLYFKKLKNCAKFIKRTAFPCPRQKKKDVQKTLKSLKFAKSKGHNFRKNYSSVELNL